MGYPLIGLGASGRALQQKVWPRESLQPFSSVLFIDAWPAVRSVSQMVPALAPDKCDARDFSPGGRQCTQHACWPSEARLLVAPPPSRGTTSEPTTPAPQHTHGQPSSGTPMELPLSLPCLVANQPKPALYAARRGGRLGADLQLRGCAPPPAVISPPPAVMQSTPHQYKLDQRVPEGAMPSAVQDRAAAMAEAAAAIRRERAAAYSRKTMFGPALYQPRPKTATRDLSALPRCSHARLATSTSDARRIMPLLRGHVAAGGHTLEEKRKAAKTAPPPTPLCRTWSQLKSEYISTRRQGPWRFPQRQHEPMDSLLPDELKLPLMHEPCKMVDLLYERQEQPSACAAAGCATVRTAES